MSEEKTMKKCAICKHAERTWSWQPFGPDQSPLCFTVPGHHYRGFPVVPVCDFCKVEKIEVGDTVTFDYKYITYRYRGDKFAPVADTLWDGGTTTLDPHNETVTMLCRDTPKGHDIVAYVYEPRLAQELINAYNRQYFKAPHRRGLPEG